MTICKVETCQAAQVRHITLTGEIDIANRSCVAAALRTAITDPAVTLIEVDLRGLTFIDAAGVHVLTDAHRRGSAIGKALWISGAHGHPAWVLDVLGVTALLTGPATGHG